VKFCTHEEAVFFYRISVMGQIPAFHRTYFFVFLIYTVFQKKFTLLLFAITKSYVDRFQ